MKVPMIRNIHELCNKSSIPVLFSSEQNNLQFRYQIYRKN